MEIAFLVLSAFVVVRVLVHVRSRSRRSPGRAAPVVLAPTAEPAVTPAAAPVVAPVAAPAPARAAAVRLPAPRTPLTTTVTSAAPGAAGPVRARHLAS